MTDIVERLLTGNPGGDSTYPEIMTEAAKTIESLRDELAKVNIEVDRLTRTSEAARESRDSWIKFASISERKVVELDAENAKLRAALEQINVGDGWAALIARTALTAQEKTE